MKISAFSTHIAPFADALREIDWTRIVRALDGKTLRGDAEAGALLREALKDAANAFNDSQMTDDERYADERVDEALDRREGI